MTLRLDRLFRPSSIAVIGGGDVCRYVIENCSKLGFSGDVWDVHPKRGTYKSVHDLPSPPDVAFVGVNRFATLDIMAELSAMGAGGAVAYASGFLEAEEEVGDGAQMQAKLLQAAGDMPLIGPNCYGFINYLDKAGLWPDQQGGQPCEKGVAIITQSSNIAINLTMQKRGLPVSYIVTAGNQAQMGLSDIGVALLSDDRVTALGLHIEGVGDLRRFEALAAEAHKCGKPIVAVKAGQSEQAQAATISHTASLAGSAAGSKALLRRLGIAEVGSLSEMLETLKLLHVAGPLPTNRIASMSCSGGEASLMADRAVGRNLDYPPLTEPQSAALRAALGTKVALANPLDYHTYIWADGDAMSETFSAMMTGTASFGVVVADFPRNDRCSDADWEPVIQGVKAAHHSSGLPMGIAAALPENMPETTASRLIDMGIVPFSGMDEALSALEAAAFIGTAEPSNAPVLLPHQVEDAEILTEAKAKSLLQTYGLKIPNSERVEGAANVAKAAKTIGFPLVIKGEGIAHKTEAGAVKVNIQTAQEATDIANQMPADNFLLEEMITGSVAELLVGITLDEAHGMLLTIGAGGTLTELLTDSVNLLVPSSKSEIETALQSLKVSKLINGYRGAPGANMTAILDAIDAIQSFVIAQQGKVTEVEVNPLICTPDSAVAADALIKGRDL